MIDILLFKTNESEKSKTAYSTFSHTALTHHASKIRMKAKTKFQFHMSWGAFGLSRLKLGSNVAKTNESSLHRFQLGFNWGVLGNFDLSRGDVDWTLKTSSDVCAFDSFYVYKQFSVRLGDNRKLNETLTSWNCVINIANILYNGLRVESYDSSTLFSRIHVAACEINHLFSLCCVGQTLFREQLI